MRLTLSNTLRTRPGDYLKDSRVINAYPDIKNGEAVARKRPGCNPAGFDFATPLQGFSSIASLMTELPYGTWGDISGLLFAVGNDSYSFTDIQPRFNPAKTYAIGDFIWYAPGAYNEETDQWTTPADPDYPKPSEWKPYYAHAQVIGIPPKKSGPLKEIWSEAKPPVTRFRCFYANVGYTATAASAGSAAAIGWAAFIGTEATAPPSTPPNYIYYPGGPIVSSPNVYAMQYSFHIADGTSTSAQVQVATIEQIS